MSVPDTLRKAADIIDQRGWCQGLLMRESGVCADGAIRMAVTGGATPYEPMAANLEPLLDTTRAELHIYTIQTGRMRRPPAALPLASTYMNYNDCPHTTKDDVTGLLRECAEWIESHPKAVLAEIEQNSELVPA